MPIITLEAGKLSKEQKRQLVKELTATSSQILNIPEQAFIVLLNENELDNFGSGGKLVSELSKGGNE